MSVAICQLPIRHFFNLEKGLLAKHQHDKSTHSAKQKNTVDEHQLDHDAAESESTESDKPTEHMSRKQTDDIPIPSRLLTKLNLHESNNDTNSSNIQSSFASQNDLTRNALEEQSGQQCKRGGQGQPPVMQTPKVPHEFKHKNCYVSLLKSLQKVVTEHQGTDSSEGSYQCKLCDRSLTREYFFTSHLKTHSGEIQEQQKERHIDSSFLNRDDNVLNDVGIGTGRIYLEGSALDNKITAKKTTATEEKTPADAKDVIHDKGTFTCESHNDFLYLNNTPMNVREFSLFTDLTRHSRRRGKKPFHFGIRKKLSWAHLHWKQTNKRKKKLCADSAIPTGELQRIVTVTVKTAT